MKRLYLLRHAEALSTAQDDKSRTLSETGKQQASALNIVMKEQGYLPDYIACSDAVRTRETLDLVWPDHEAHFPPDFYNASPGDLLNHIQKIDNNRRAALIVNHNPTIHQLAFLLAGKGEDTDLQSLATGYMPCTLSVIDCPIDDWNDLAPGDNTLSALIPPRL